MPLTNDTLREWLASLPKGTVVAIDDSGFYLATEGMQDYIEVGMFPEADDEPAPPPQASYLHLLPGHRYDLTFLSEDQSETISLKQARFHRVQPSGHYWFATQGAAFNLPPANILTCTESA